MQRLAAEWQTLTYLALSQALLFYYFPAFTRFSQLGRVGITALATLFCAYVFCYVVWFPREFRWMIDLDIFDDAPNPRFVKKLFWYAMGAVLTATYLYLWFADFHRVAGFWYVIWYAQAALSIFLFHKIIGRSIKS
jgi:hypothetical protein